MFGRDLRGHVPDIKNFKPWKVHGDVEVCRKDTKQKVLHKLYLDKRRRAKTVLVKAGYTVTVKQAKTTIQPP